ncbi:MAG: glutamate racemase [Akkermansiaceae bacterium]
MNQQPIGILDSGLGGLSVLNEIRALLPHENIVYFGDSAWCPYGAKTAEEIQSRVFAISDFLLEKNCKLIVIACNSATINAVEALRATYPVPIVGMEPGIKPAAALTKSGTIGVLATEASISGEKYHKLLNTHSGGVKVITRSAPRFVELVERGELTGENALDIIEEETRPLIDAGADVLVLGCTHYPFLRPLIQQAVGNDVHILDTGAAVAKHVKTLLNEQLNKEIQTNCEVFTSGDLSHLKNLFSTLCPHVSASITAGPPQL